MLFDYPPLKTKIRAVRELQSLERPKHKRSEITFMPTKSSISKTSQCKCHRCGVEISVQTKRRRVSGNWCSLKCYWSEIGWNEKRFWKCFEKSGECLLWTKGKDSSGYGYGRGPDGEQDRVHRIVWNLKIGPIPQNMCVLHHCDCRPCGNVDHLFLGTNADNVADKMSKMRQFRKLEPSEVRQIRDMASVKRYKDIARLFDISWITVREIVHRRIWAHLK